MEDTGNPKGSNSFQGVPSGPQEGPTKNQRSLASTFDEVSNSSPSQMAMAAAANFGDSPQRPAEATEAQDRAPTTPSKQNDTNFDLESANGAGGYEGHTSQRTPTHPHWSTHNTYQSPQPHHESPQDGRSEYRDYRHMLTPTHTLPYIDTPPRDHSPMGPQHNYHHGQGQGMGFSPTGYPPHRFPPLHHPAARMLNFGPQGTAFTPQQPTNWGLGPTGLPLPSARLASFMDMGPGSDHHTPPPPPPGMINNYPQQHQQQWNHQRPPPLPHTVTQNTTTQVTQRGGTHHTGHGNQRRGLSTPDRALSLRILNDREDFDLALLSRVVNMIREAEPEGDADGPIEPLRAAVQSCLNTLGVTHTGAQTQNISNTEPTTPQVQTRHKGKEEKEGREGKRDNNKTHDPYTTHTIDPQVDPHQEVKYDNSNDHIAPQTPPTTQVDHENKDESNTHPHTSQQAMAVDDDSKTTAEEQESEGRGGMRLRPKTSSDFYKQGKQEQEEIIKTRVQELNQSLQESGLHISSITDISHPAYPGRQVIATRRLAPHTEIGEYAGEKLTREEKEERYPGDLNDGYIFDSDNGLFIDGLDPRLANATRFINGSTSELPANTAAIAEGGKIHIYTTQAIGKHEELLLNYGPAYIFHKTTPPHPPPTIHTDQHTQLGAQAQQRAQGPTMTDHHQPNIGEERKVGVAAQSATGAYAAQADFDYRRLSHVVPIAPPNPPPPPP
jgi:hypothetical protein